MQILISEIEYFYCIFSILHVYWLQVAIVLICFVSDFFRESPRKKAVTASKKTNVKKARNQKKSATKKMTKTKTVAKKTMKAQSKDTKVPKSPAVSPRKLAKKSPSKKVPKKSPRRSIPKRSPWKATSAKKGIHLYLQQQGMQPKPKSASKSAKKSDKVALKEENAESAKTKKSPSPRKSPRKNQGKATNKQPWFCTFFK